MKKDLVFRMPISIHSKNEYKYSYLKIFRTLKRLIDIIVSLIVVLVIYPILIPIIAILIKLDSKGSVFFVQQRVGYHNQIFKCLKFRTMSIKNESNEITRIGRLLRNMGLDELPQFINVLKGDMSIIGPRPYSIEDNLIFCTLVENYDVRNIVKPGITGLAQVYGYKGPITDSESIKIRTSLDIMYLNHPSIVQEIKILVLTIRLVISEFLKSIWVKRKT